MKKEKRVFRTLLDLGEEGLIDALFEAFAAEGALLLTYHGMNEMKLQRKVN